MTELRSFLTINETCSASPFQVDGVALTDEGDKFYYFRYRFGLVTFGLGDTEDEAVENSISNFEVRRHENRCTDTAGSCFCSGWISPREMLALARHILGHRLADRADD